MLKRPPLPPLDLAQGISASRRSRNATAAALYKESGVLKSKCDRCRRNTLVCWGVIAPDSHKSHSCGDCVIAGRMETCGVRRDEVSLACTVASGPILIMALDRTGHRACCPPPSSSQRGRHQCSTCPPHITAATRSFKTIEAPMAREQRSWTKPREGIRGARETDIPAP